MSRYDQDDAAMIVGAWTITGADPAPVGTRLSIGGNDVHTLVLQTGRSARIDDYSKASGMAAGIVRKADVRSAAGVPISVAGRLWGIVVIASAVELPPDTEARLADFTELVGTAVGNAQSRAELGASRTFDCFQPGEWLDHWFLLCHGPSRPLSRGDTGDSAV
jgi:GAF domain-containing protein